jgi:lysozyme
MLSVRFTTPMNRATTARAFAVVIAGAKVTGTVSWFENDTVLVFKPATALTSGAAVGVRVLGTATSAGGVPIARGGSATFKVAAAPKLKPTARKPATKKPVIGAGGATAIHPVHPRSVPLPTPKPIRQPVHTTAGAALEGIDISHHDGPIDWRQVAAAGTDFAYVKASEGTDYVDPTYATNRANAEAAGLKVGAFHYAQPDASAGEAAAEADHFVEAAAFRKGELLPMLDLEETNGLSPTALQAWVASFLDRVYQRTGLHAGIYVSPSFWQTYLSDTALIASRGYGVLWIADWTAAPSPWVPASNWGGLGWTLWQYDHRASVAGVPGPVDVDHFSGSDLAGLLIR